MRGSADTRLSGLIYYVVESKNEVLKGRRCPLIWGPKRKRKHLDYNFYGIFPGPQLNISFQLKLSPPVVGAKKKIRPRDNPALRNLTNRVLYLLRLTANLNVSIAAASGENMEFNLIFGLNYPTQKLSALIFAGRERKFIFLLEVTIVLRMSTIKVLHYFPESELTTDVRKCSLKSLKL